MKTVALSLFLRPLIASALALLPACQVTVETSDASGSTSSTGGPSTSAGSSSGGSIDPGPAPGPASAELVRFGGFSPTLGPFDVCAGPDGPLLAAHGLGGGLELGQVSRYLPAAAPGASWTLVPAGASCSDPAGVVLDIAWPAGAEHGPVTVVPWRGKVDGVEAITARAYLDEPINNEYGINLRVLDFAVYHEAGSSGASIGVHLLGPGEQDQTALFPLVEFAAVPTDSPMGAVTAAGFVHTPYIAVGPLMIVPNAYTNQIVTTGAVPIPGGAEGNAYGVGSIFVSGGLYDGTARVLVCADNAPAVGALSSCTEPPQ